MDAKERARLRALYEGIATPWSAVEHHEDGECFGRVSILCDGGDFPPDEVALIDMGHDTECDEAHAALIVGAVNALPVLLDDADAADARIAKAERERDEAVAMLRNLLARVHRDGGHHSDAVGLAQATEEADEIIARDFAELARLRAPRPSAIVLRPVDPMTARGLPCACDEWGSGHLDGCPSGDESTDGRDA